MSIGLISSYISYVNSLSESLFYGKIFFYMNPSEGVFGMETLECCKIEKDEFHEQTSS